MQSSLNLANREMEEGDLRPQTPRDGKDLAPEGSKGVTRLGFELSALVPDGSGAPFRAPLELAARVIALARGPMNAQDLEDRISNPSWMSFLAPQRE